METDYVDIKPLIEYSKKNPDIPSQQKNTFIQYTEEIMKFVDLIPGESGWYMWGRITKKGKWKTIYIGKSERGLIASLRERIKEELKDERIAFWASVYGEKKAFEKHSKLFDGRYDREAKRGLKKMGAQFIIWVVDRNNDLDQLEEEEDKLIDHYEPIANSKRKKPQEFSEKTGEIIKKFDETIKVLKSN